MDLSISNFKSILEEWFSEKITKRSLNFDIVLMLLILISSIIYISFSFVEDPLVKLTLIIIDTIILILFSLEIILRFFITNDKKKHFMSIYTWIDILAVVPFWFGFSSTQFLRLFRFFRIFRFLKFLRFSPQYLNLNNLEENFHVERLLVIRILLTILMFVFISSALVYEFEKDINDSINTFWNAFYFVIISATTVGYGDIVAKTIQAQVVVVITIVATLIIIPTQISSALKFFLLNKEGNQNKLKCKFCKASNHNDDSTYCYNCGKKL